MSITFEPLSERTHDATTNVMQREINEACRWILDAMRPDEPWECPHCDVTTARPEWVKSLRHISYEAERRRRAAGGGGWLAGSIYSLAVYHLRDQGLLEQEIGRGIRLRLVA